MYRARREYDGSRGMHSGQDWQVNFSVLCSAAFIGWFEGAKAILILMQHVRIGDVFKNPLTLLVVHLAGKHVHALSKLRVRPRDSMSVHIQTTMAFGVQAFPSVSILVHCFQTPT